MTTIVWFRQDLRIHDNPALSAAAERGAVVPVFFLDEANQRPLGGASRWWLHYSLAALNRDIGGISLFRGDALDLLPRIVEKVGASAVTWNRCYEPLAIARDKELKSVLQNKGVEVRTFNGSLLREPWEAVTGSDTPFKVFTPYLRASRTRPVAKPLPAPKLQSKQSGLPGDRLNSWKLLPENPNWAAGWEKLWQPGEVGARRRLDEFLEATLANYGDARDRPDINGTSRLSPHLHWGEISPRQVWARLLLNAEQKGHRNGTEKFLSEIVWREFCYHLLYYFPTIPEENWRREFDAFPWRNDARDLRAWQRGRTGYPLVDAGLRELWRTGWMHNRVRMIVASFLVKHLRIHWRQGEAWFWDTLLDADLANNAASWQWVAGSGADASPYFRIFNPVLQGQKFDPKGDYVRRWCPELARLPDDFIHSPFAAPPRLVAQAGITLGETYPLPVVDHATARAAALAGYAKVRATRARKT